MTDPAPTTSTKRQSQAFWRVAWRRFRRSGRGVAGLLIVLGMLLLSALSPLVATNQPILCKYQGNWHFPAIVEIFQSRTARSHWINKAPPFNLPQFNAKAHAREFEFALWPLIPYHEYEQTVNFLQPPSSRHWLGTDELGRDVAARLVHGTTVSVKVGFVSMGIAVLIGVVLGAAAG